MDAKNRLSDAIVLMMIVLMWTALILFTGWMVFGWMVESFGREIALVTTFAAFGVILAIILWITSSRHTTAIWRSALSYAADSQQESVNALRSLSTVHREDAKALRYREQANAQIEVASYRAALTDARQQVKQEMQQQPAAPTWLTDNDDVDGSFRWLQ